MPSSNRTPTAPTTARKYVPHGRFAANLDAQIAARFCERRRQAAHAALHVIPTRHGAARLAHHVMQQHIRAAGRADRKKRADDRIGRERGLQHVALEPAVENRPGRAGEQFDGLRQVVAQLADRLIERPQFLAVAKPFAEADVAPLFRQRQRIGRGLAQHRLEHGRHTFQERIVFRIGVRIARAELRNLAPAQLRVGAHQQAAAIG